MYQMHGNEEERLDALFRAYARACPTPEPSAHFMPNLWTRIESRQSFTFSFRRMANALVTAAVALARPQHGTLKEQVTTRGVDIVVALDVSGSMAAEDFQPRNRLRSKFRPQQCVCCLRTALGSAEN